MNSVTFIDRGSRWESDKILDSLIDNAIDVYIEEGGVTNSIWDDDNCLNKWAEDFINEALEEINKSIIVSGANVSATATAGKKRSRPAERATSDSVSANTRAAKRKRSETVAGNTRAAKRKQ